MATLIVRPSLSTLAIVAIIAAAGCSPDATPTAATKPTEKRTEISQAPSSPAATENTAMNSANTAKNTSAAMNRTEEEWKKSLTPEQYRVLREKGTERPFTGKYWDTKTPGVYKCAACGVVLFSSDSKFDSGCGWPSFDSMIAAGTVKEHVDNSFGTTRTEVTCASCGGHLGHVFNDGPTKTGLRYCINSASIELDDKPDAKKPDAKPDGK